MTESRKSWSERFSWWWFWRTARLLLDEVERLQEALRPFAKAADEIEASEADIPFTDTSQWFISLGDLRAARAALAALEPE